MKAENANQEAQSGRKNLHFHIVNEENLPFAMNENLPAKVGDQLEYEIIDITPKKPGLSIPFNVDLGPVLDNVIPVLKVGTFLGASAGTGWLVFIVVRFVLAWFWTPVLLIGIAFLLFLKVCMGSLSRGSMRSHDAPERSTDRNINITNIVEGDGSGDINITNIVK